MNVPLPRLLLVLFALALAFAGAARGETIRGSGHFVSEERAVAGFDAIGLALPAHVEIVQDGVERLLLTVDDNVAPYVETEVRDGRLVVRGRSGVELRPTRLARIVVHVRELRSVALAGTVDVRIPMLRAARFVLDIGGSGDVQLGILQARDFSARVGGTGRVSVADDVDRLEVAISGTGTVAAERLRAHRASISISGSGRATTWPRDSLEARINGVGQIRYYGDPAVDKRIAGVGSVTRMGAAPG
jgi:Putative auto-transporter adhesin, head GIN domain